MNQAKLRSDGNRCFVCGPENPIGLQLAFRMDGDVCRAEFTPGPDHVGFDGVTHGGIIYSALDDVMANYLYLLGTRAHTAKCEVRYREPLATGDEVGLEGRLIKRKGRLAQLEGRVVRKSDGRTVAEAQASFMVDSGGG